MGRWRIGLLAFLCAAAGAEESGLHIPQRSSATITTGRDQTTIRYPFGKVEIPLGGIAGPDPKTSPLGTLHARTQGVFRLSYELAREGKIIVAHRVRVWVESDVTYLSPATPKLREHEGMHRRINEAEARRMERELSAFRAEGIPPVEAERKLKQEFRLKVAEVRKLHAVWDENHVFISPAASKVSPGPQ